jgi:N4-gp56 family major capsid protein
MALGSNHVTGSGVATGTAQTFIPEIWSDEIIASYEKSLVVKPLVRAMSMVGKKGDTIHIPKPDRGDASAKAAEAQVTLIAGTTDELIVTIDQHFEYSRLIEDITDVQALNSLRRFYTEDAGYALARNVDSAIIAESAGFTAQLEATATGTQAGAGTAVAFNDAAFRSAIQVLDDNDVPGDSRVFVIPPAVKREMLGESQYISSDFVTGRPVENGKIGSLYGVDIYVTTNLPVASGEAGCLLMHKDAIVFAEQLGVRVQTQYKQEWLSDLMTADTLYGTETYRPEAGVVLNVAV